MAEKEERILIARSTDYTLTDTDKGELFEGKIAPHCANVMKRQEAIAEMAYAMLKADDTEASNEWLQLQWNSTRIRNHYMVMAEAALNALLLSGEAND